MRPTLCNNPLLAALTREPSPSLAAGIMWRDAYTCQYCKVARATEIDHVRPWIQGGPTIASNLVAACEHCNRSKGGRTPVEWEIAKRRRAAQTAALRKRVVKARKRPLRKARGIPGATQRPTLAELLRS
jgi:5-methylcytosine-specific restriction endonuclease McrA